jgi:ADP-ribose pyrophosphatase
MEERVLESRRVYDGRIVSLRVDTIAFDDSVTASREVVEHSQAVAVVPVAPDGRIVLVRQYRLPAQRELLELPAGSLDPGEDPETAAQRELQEETGFAAGRLSRLTGIWVAPGYCTEYIHIYAAEDLRESRLDADHDERIELEMVTLEDALHRIDIGEIEDAKSLCGLLQYARRTARGGTHPSPR